MAKSDTDECCDSPPTGFAKMLEETHFDKSNDLTIHSGHFMVSFVHDETEADGEEEPEETSLPEKEPEPGYDFVTATKETSSSYQFGNKCTQTVAIDASLTKLFDCMTLAYSGKLTSPKWKNFKGIKLRLKDKVRMNNMIWREWHMQFIQGKLPIICQFEPPISDRTHTKPEAVVLEGKYWKRRLESVTAEYKKWRLFFRDRAMGIGSEDIHLMQEVASHAELLERVAQHDFFRFSQQQMIGQALTDHNIPDDPEDLMDFSDTLFTTFNQPFAFPNPKEMSQLGNADIIQPGLVQLQPSFDECMDTLEPLPSLQEMMGLLPQRSNHLVNNFSPMETSRQNHQQGETSMQLDGNTFDNSNAYLNSIPNSIQSNRNFDYSQSLIDSSHSQPGLMHGQQPVQQQVVSNSNFAGDCNDATAQIINLVFTGLSQPGTTTIQQQPITLVSQGQNQQIQHTQLSNIGVAGPQNLSGTVTIIPSQLQTLLQGLSQNQTILTQTVTQAPQTQVDTKHSESLIRPATYPKLQTGTTGLSSRVKLEREGHRRGSTGSITNNKQINNSTSFRKKDGDFLVPQTTVPRSKQRIIAPAPVASIGGKPSVAETNTFLAQLLTTGTVKGNYPGTHGLTTLKEEVVKEKPEYNQVPAITTNPSSPPNFNFTGNPTVSDFQKNVLIAAASQALNTTNVKFTEAISSGAILSAGSSPVASPGSPNFIGSPGSEGSPSGKGKKVKQEQDKQQYKESRRVNHISAEQKRRCNIKSGFDTLHQLVPSLSANPNAKISKAATLQKGAEYCRKLKEERAKMQEESEILRKEIEVLNHSISMCQSQLPATGVPVTRQRVDQMKDMFDGYVRERTLGNWKFWIFSIIIRPLFDSFNSMVSTASVDELCRTVLAWLQQHCSLPILRPAVLNSLRVLSTTTSILSDPGSVPEQAKLAVTKKSPKNNRS